jgi:DNA-binding NarL/FixJ family response regulator
LRRARRKEAKLIKVLIVDDNDLDRDGLKYTIVDESDLEIVGEATNGMEAVEMAQELKPDVVLMDLRIPVMGGVEATKKIAEMEPAPRIIAMTTYETEREAGPAMNAGAAAYLKKDAPTKDLLRAIRGGAGRAGPKFEKAKATRMGSLPRVGSQRRGQADQGEEERQDRRERRASFGDAARPGSDIFSEVELDVLTYAARGLSNAQIAAKLAIEPAEVREHLLRIYREFGVRDRAGIRVVARRRKML